MANRNETPAETCSECGEPTVSVKGWSKPETKKMIKKETLKKYIDGIQHQNDAEQKLFEALKFIQPDNYNISLVSETYSMAMEAVLEEFMGAVAYDYLQWWMWETNAGMNNNVSGVEPEVFDSDGKLLHTLDTFDKLYDYLLQCEPWFFFDQSDS